MSRDRDVRRRHDSSDKSGSDEDGSGSSSGSEDDDESNSSDTNSDSDSGSEEDDDDEDYVSHSNQDKVTKRGATASVQATPQVAKNPVGRPPSKDLKYRKPNYMLA